MTRPVWPVALPQYFLAKDFSEQRVDILLRTPMEVGNDKSRPRFTKATKVVGGTIMVSLAQKELLDEFYLVILANGSQLFDWVDPVSQTDATYRFMERPKVAGGTGVRFPVTMKLLQV